MVQKFMTENARRKLDLMSDYSFKLDKKVVSYCSNCFKRYKSYSNFRKHTIGCSHIQEGVEIFRRDRIRIIQLIPDRFIKDFLNKRFSLFIDTYSSILESHFRLPPYNENFHYWIVQYDHPNFGFLPISFAYVRPSVESRSNILALIVVFPEVVQGRGVGSIFIRELESYYGESFIAENPINPISEDLIERFNIKSYHRF